MHLEPLDRRAPRMGAENNAREGREAIMAMEATAAKAGGLTDDEKIELDRLREENA
jgi:hypothetical protein